MPLRNPLKSIARLFLGTVTRVDTTEPIVALTFDDGPHPEYTPKLLDILDQHNAHATFFMVGRLAEKHPTLVKDVSQRGHSIGNHSWDHPSFPFLKRSERLHQIRKCSSVLLKCEDHLFRPPFGHQSIASRIDAWSLGYDVIAWNLLADDWLDHESEHIYKGLSGHIKPGSIILLHDSLFCTDNPTYLNRAPTLESVDRLLAECREYKFVTIPELMKRGRAVRQLWQKSGDPEWLSRQKSWDENNEYI